MVVHAIKMFLIKEIKDFVKNFENSYVRKLPSFNFKTLQVERQFTQILLKKPQRQQTLNNI